MITDFRQLRVYQAARRLNEKVWGLRSAIEPQSKGTWWQIDRSAGSVMDNIAEGFGRATPADFKNFLRFSRGSANEVQAQLDRSLDRRLITQDQHRRVDNDCKSVLLKLEGLTKNLEQRQQAASLKPSSVLREPITPYGETLEVQELLPPWCDL